MVQYKNYSAKIQQYFASANSGRGFESYFDRIFDISDFKKIYILKGGPGTGKSTIMRRMCEVAVKCGLEFEQILCSSDPDSLDGVIISSPRGRIGILDGTAPHTRDTLSPGAVDEMIDLGRFWDSAILEMHRKTILELQNKKREAYANSYSILRSALVYLNRKNTILRECLNKHKLEDAVTRILGHKCTPEADPRISYKLSHAISAKGECSCDLYENMYDRSFAVYGSHGAAFAVLEEIRLFAETHKQNITVSPSPLCPDILDGISVDSSRISFYDAGKYKPTEGQKAINSERFLIQDKIKEAKPTLRMLTKLYEDAMACAYTELSRSRTYHFGLEEIYTSAVNFEKMNILKEYLAQNIRDFCT